MERFTKKVDGVWTALCKYGNSPYPVVTQEIIDRLAAYEDTGLTPGEVQQMRWIPVEERLPEEGKRCLLYTPCDGIICVGYYAGKDEWQHRHKWRLVTAMRSTQTLTKKVTHWMPLPPSPQILSGNTKGGKEK